MTEWMIKIEVSETAKAHTAQQVKEELQMMFKWPFRVLEVEEETE